MDETRNDDRPLGLFSATSVGVGAIVGGGILALAGAAFSTTGPSAVIAFALNGVIALLTALSFSEMASKFPESGGVYTFSKKVVSVEAAFTVGWVVWFASIVAGVLYAVGFGHFTLVLTRDVIDSLGWTVPAWLGSPRSDLAVALLATSVVALSMLIRAGGGGSWANIGKVLVFSVLIVGGIIAVIRTGPIEAGAALRPFFTGGATGLFQAMGYSFIALQGFDLIAAVGGEVRNPSRNLPRAMIGSLVIALSIYLPLLLVIGSVGVPEGKKIAEVAAADPEAVVAVAARNYLGAAGYVFVVIAAVLSMFTALEANLYAASRIAYVMSRDHTLPHRLSRLSKRRGIPTLAVLATATLILLLILLLPNVATAGAASSLIFLVTFAIAHWLSILIRIRSTNAPPFQTPLFPLVPILGGVSCLALAVFQGFAVPSAGSIAVTWLSIGGILFLTLFARRARLTDVSTIAANPELARLRGNSPLVLVPVANPHHAEGMIALADTLVPSHVGRVLLQTIVVAPNGWHPDDDPAPADASQRVLRELLRKSSELGVRTEALTTVSPQPMQEIARVARLHQCESVLLGLSELSDSDTLMPLENLIGQLDADVVVLRAADHWHPDRSLRILVPVAGRGGHDQVLARLLGSLARKTDREVTFIRVIATTMRQSEARRARRDLRQLARENFDAYCKTELISSDDPISTIVERARDSDLLILGARRVGMRQRLLGDLTTEIARRTGCALIVLSRRERW